jgi:hypothetical protein
MIRTADDIETISRRIAELQAERERAFQCTCEQWIGDSGSLVPIRSAGCPVHGELAGALATAGYRVDAGPAYGPRRHIILGGWRRSPLKPPPGGGAP